MRGSVMQRHDELAISAPQEAIVGREEECAGGVNGEESHARGQAEGQRVGFFNDFTRSGRSCDLAVVITTLPRTVLATLTSLCQWRADPRCPRCVQSPNSSSCECRNRTWPPRVRCNAGVANASATRSATADTHLHAKPNQPVCCGCGGNQTASYRGCVKWKEAKAALAKQAHPEKRRHSPPCRS